MAQGVAIAKEQRQAIIEAALPLLAQGIGTDTIAKPYGITGKTLRVWLMTLPEAEEARTTHLTERILEASDTIDNATDALELSKGEKQFKVASWMAERRLSQLYGAKSEVSHGVQVSVTINNPSHTTSSIETVRQPVTLEAQSQPIELIEHSTNNL